MDIGNLMKQAKEIQEKMQRLQEELAEEKVDFSSGGGVIKATVNGKHELIQLSISEEVLDDKEMLEDLIVAAINGAMRKADELIKDKMGEMTGGLDLPF